VFVLMGGMERYVAADARIGLHRPSFRDRAARRSSPPWQSSWGSTPRRWASRGGLSMTCS
jgi:hypothetical protein